MAIGRAAAAGQIASEVGTSPAVVAAAGMRSEGVRGDTTDQALAAVAAAAPPAWDLEVEAGASAVVVAADGAGSRHGLGNRT